MSKEKVDVIPLADVRPGDVLWYNPNPDGEVSIFAAIPSREEVEFGPERFVDYVTLYANWNGSEFSPWKMRRDQYEVLRIAGEGN
ncbi:hypothetical protein [Streptomyces sp. NPDC002644]